MQDTNSAARAGSDYDCESRQYPLSCALVLGKSVEEESSARMRSERMTMGSLGAWLEQACCRAAAALAYAKSVCLLHPASKQTAHLCARPSSLQVLRRRRCFLGRSSTSSAAHVEGCSVGVAFQRMQVNSGSFAAADRGLYWAGAPFRLVNPERPGASPRAPRCYKSKWPATNSPLVLTVRVADLKHNSAFPRFGTQTTVRDVERNAVS